MLYIDNDDGQSSQYHTIKLNISVAMDAWEKVAMVAGFHPERIILGGKLQEVGVALYTFLYNCTKFWGGSFPPTPPPPLWMKPWVDYEELASKSLLISHLAELAKKGTVNVLDVGCGTGMFWKILSKEIKQQFPDS